MLRVYKLGNGKTYRYEEGEQPEGAVLVERASEKPETPEERVEKVAARKRKAKAKKSEED